VTGLVRERLAGCTAESLDSYLRGLGFFLLAGDIEPSVRAWWDEEGVLWMATRAGLTDLAGRVTAAVMSGALRSIETPWRGKQAGGRSFVELRNACAEVLLDWFDSCSVPRPEQTESRRPEHAERQSRQRSEKENNPLLGEGGGYGNSRLEAAQTKAVDRLRKAGPATSAGGLVALLGGSSGSGDDLKDLSLRGVAPLTAYQSARGTGPGASARDVAPTTQRRHVHIAAWDVVFLLEALRVFRGVVTRDLRADGEWLGSALASRWARGAPVPVDRRSDL